MKAHASLGLVCLVTALAVPCAHAQVFEPVVQARWISIFAQATVVGQDGRSAHDQQMHYQPLLGASFGLFDFSDSFAFDVVAPDGTAAAHLASDFSQSSFIGASSISYEARLNGSASLAGTPGPQSFVELGNATRGNFMGVRFVVAQPMQVLLTLHADVTHQGLFEFRLADFNTDEVVYHAQPHDSAPGGPVIPLQQVTLFLAPAEYTMLADLGQSFVLSGPGEQHGAYSAGFTLTPLAIPEPDVAILLAAGLPLIGWWIRSGPRTGRRRSGSAAGPRGASRRS
jgi:hypothetical protein